jgi:hypothetical protein
MRRLVSKKHSGRRCRAVQVEAGGAEEAEGVAAEVADVHLVPLPKTTTTTRVSLVRRVSLMLDLLLQAVGEVVGEKEGEGEEEGGVESVTLEARIRLLLRRRWRHNPSLPPPCLVLLHHLFEVNLRWRLKWSCQRIRA